MCLSCGCRKPSDAHGNPDNIVIHDLERAAEAENISVLQVANNIKNGVFPGGNEDHIKREDVEAAARAANISYEQAVDNIKSTVDQYVGRSRTVLQEASSDGGPR